MAKKEEIYPEGYPRQNDSFSKEQKFKFDVFEAIKKIALETTETAFESKGYKKKEGKAGEYSNGESYGVGTSSHHFNIRLSSRPNTNTYFEKIIYFGGKKAISDITIGWDAKNKSIELAYKTSEFGAFRGYNKKDSYSGAMLINNRENFVIDSLTDFKSELKKMFKSFSDKEIAYITSTKIGIEDKTNKSIDSMVESDSKKSFNQLLEFKKELNNMKNLSIKDLMTSSNEELSNSIGNYISESKKEKNDKEDKARMDSPEVIAANSPGKLLFDDVDELEEGDFKTAAKNKLKKFGVIAVNELKPSEKKTYFEELEKELEIKEVTASGGSAAGGAYQTPFAFKKGGDLNLENQKKLEETPYAKAQKPKPYVNKIKNEGDTFWTTVELNQGSGYVPKGMENNYIAGQHTKKLNESVEPKKQDPTVLKESLIKRKFSSLNENIEKGINKRYIVTEQRTSEEQENRWKKLSLFETYETINAPDTDSCECVDNSHSVSGAQGELENEKEFMMRNSDAEAGGEVDGRTVIIVPKPNSLSNAMLKVFEDDFLNENKAYILDLNSGNLVSNPSFKVKK